MEIIFRPIQHWPGNQTKSRRNSLFKASYNDTLRQLDKELGYLSARRIVIQLALSEGDIRLDGLPRAGARPRFPGVILSFESKHGSLSYPCDTFTEWESNLRAITLSLEHLRTVDRYGVTKRGEQYRGWAQLPEKEDETTAAFNLLRVFGPLNTAEEIILAYKKSTLVFHPDKGGKAEHFIAATKAKEILLANMNGAHHA